MQCSKIKPCKLTNCTIFTNYLRIWNVSPILISLAALDSSPPGEATGAPAQCAKFRYVELVGDVFLNSMEWREAPLETIADIVSGIIKGRKIKGKQLTEVPYMAASNVKAGYIDWTTLKTIETTD